MKMLSLTWLLAMAVLLGGCATAPMMPPASTLLHDELFGPDPRPADAEQVFALSTEMQDYLAQEIAPLVRRQGKRRSLLDALYTRRMLQLEYDSALTRTAAEAFAARRGNCLSLVLMTAAFAKALDLPVRFNDVFVDELWRRSEQLFVLTGHVNLSLGQESMSRASVGGVPDMLTIDFLPSESLREQRSREIDESTVVAMYLNNRAAEQLIQGQVEQAYWWARSALRREPRFVSAYNTLGVIYRRHGRQDLAEAVFRHITALEPANAIALSNLVLVLRDQGRAQEAEPLALKLARIQPDPPYKFFDLGVAAMRAGDFGEAKRQFKREIERMAFAPDFHFALALAHYGLGEIDDARKELALARDHSATAQERQRYAAKLASLRAQPGLGKSRL